MEKWKTLKSETVFDASPYLEVVRQQVEIRPGTVIDDFYQVNLRAFVVCVPFLENGNVLAIRQYKHGPSKVSLTFPAGFTEDDELPHQSCSRELLEETGFQSGSMTHLGEFTDNGNQKGCVGNYYVAGHCKFVQEAASGDLEEMEILELPPSYIDRALFDGEIAITHHGFAWTLAKIWLQQNSIP